MVYALFIVLSGNRYTSKSIKSDLKRQSNEEVAVERTTEQVTKIDGAELEKSELSGSQRRASQFIGSSDEVPAIEPLSELSPMKVDPPTNVEAKEIDNVEPNSSSPGKAETPETVEPASEVTREGSAPDEAGQITEVAKEGKRKSYFGIFKK